MMPSPIDIGVRGRVDRHGRLVAADAALLALQTGNGAGIGDALVMPGLARLALLAHRTAARIERPIIMANGAKAVHAIARLVPDRDGVEISFAEWIEQPVTVPEIAVNVYAQLTPSPIRWACDVRLRLVMVDGPAPLIGDASQWMGQSLSRLFHLEPNVHGRFPLLDALADQIGFDDQNVQAMTPGGGSVAMRLAAQPMFDGDHLTGFVGDAAARVAAASAHATTPRADDAALTGALGTIDPRRFALRVDGAMRRPIGRIIANAETIAGQLDGPIRADYARYAQDIALAGRHLMDLVDDLADLQILERSDFTVASEPVDLAEVARRAAGLLSLKARERGMSITVPDSDEAAPVTAEFRRVLQILLNLIGNAIRYAPEGSQIWLCVGDDADAFWLTVADQGAGIAIDDQERLFEKFERLGRSDSGGSGLGLYISRKLARAMGGDITLDSAPGQGARFTLRLPR